MISFKRIVNISGWLVFAIALIVYFFSAERTGSLWDCGEFILGAYKLQVVHPPGAPLFLLVGRIFAWLGDMFSSDPANIAFAVNLSSSICTAFAAMFVAWITIMMSKLALVGREREANEWESVLLGIVGLIAGLTTAFCTSIWFSAVEGEVYAMSTFFTTLTLWSIIKWYYLPPKNDNDRWLVFALYAAGLSIGVHLLSLLTLPVLGIIYYFKKYEKIQVKGIILSLLAGLLLIGLIQKVIIVGIPTLWSQMELLLVNGMGLPFHSGLIPTFLIVFGLIAAGLYYAHKKNNGIFQRFVVAVFLVIVGFSTIGVVLIRANANTPINMNNPNDAMRLIPYLNREQYGERPLLRGPHFDADPVDTETTDRYGKVGDRYEVTDYKVRYVYNDADKMLFPRLFHTDQGRRQLHRNVWMGGKKGTPTQIDNIKFLFRYQVGWMYWRYFMWNFSGRQNGTQGYYPMDDRHGKWITGIKFLDEARLYNMDELTDTMKNHKAANKYYLLPFLFGILGMIFHFRKKPKDFFVLFTIFILTGIALIIYSNQPPNEPRERDYVLVGSFFTFAMWIGMGALFLFQELKKRLKIAPIQGVALAGALVLSAPLIMGFQNFDDHSRRHHTGARDYANNFLESCEPNAIIFTYGDNDTYPLWYAQEVEGIRRDVRVVNLSLIAVDWYIEQLRRKVNDSPPINFTISEDSYRGYKRNQVFFYDPNNRNRAISLDQSLKFVNERHPLPTARGRDFESYFPSSNIFIPVNKQKAISSGWIDAKDGDKIINRIPINLGNKRYLQKDQIAVLDILNSNVYDRPIYFAVTNRQEKLLGLDNYFQLEGLAMRFIPVNTPGERDLQIYGSGRVDSDKVHENVTQKWRWGNFDKMELFVDNSYAASVQAHKMTIMRAARDLSRNGDFQKAKDLCDTYFEGFPHMNFAYDGTIIPFINIYVQIGEEETAKKHLRILIDELAQNMEFYYSLSDQDLQQGWATEMRYDNMALNEIKSMMINFKDEDFKQEIIDIIKLYEVTDLRN